MRKTILSLLLALLVQGALRAEGTNTVTIAAASDLALCLDEINAAFTAAHPGAICKVSTGSSGNFFNQIQHGAPFDVFLSADKGFPQKLAAAGLADTNTLFIYAIGQLMLWTADTNIDVRNGLQILTNGVIKKIAVANPDTAPYGRAAKATLQNAGLWDALQPKIVIGENIAQTAQFVQTRNADIGFVAFSFVSSPKLKGVGASWPVPEELHPRLEQAAILTAHGADNAAARAYLDYLRTPGARQVFERFGFHPPEK